jgi:hypothetical protein
MRVRSIAFFLAATSFVYSSTALAQGAGDAGDAGDDAAVVDEAGSPMDGSVGVGVDASVRMDAGAGADAAVNDAAANVDGGEETPGIAETKVGGCSAAARSESGMGAVLLGALVIGGSLALRRSDLTRRIGAASRRRRAP